MKARKNIDRAGIIFGSLLTALYILTGCVTDVLELPEALNLSPLTVSVITKAFYTALGLMFLKYVYKNQFSRLFVHRPPSRTLLFILPAAAFMIFEVLSVIDSSGVYPNCGMVILRLFISAMSTGVIEETLMRGVLMSGMIVKRRGSPFEPLFMCCISGALFGLAHFSAISEGYDLTSVLLRCLSCGLWGIYISAVYLYCENLTLVMVIHGLWDFAVYIPEYIYRWEGFLPGYWGSRFDGITDFISSELLPLTGVVISLFLYEWKAADRAKSARARITMTDCREQYEHEERKMNIQPDVQAQPADLHAKSSDFSALR